MKIIIAGSRDFSEYEIAKEFIEETLHAWFHKHITGNDYYPREIVSGGASGADRLGEIYASQMKIKVTHFLPDWKVHGKSAGPIRNKEMAEYADALICFWDGQSKGTKNMIDNMERLKKPVSIHLTYT